MYILPESVRTLGCLPGQLEQMIEPNTCILPESVHVRTLGLCTRSTRAND